jgi:heme-degrading monooxygenase HmoA
MFMAIISFPPIRAGKDAEFLEWFAWTNKEFSAQKGFIRRRLLKPLQGGSYAEVVEHESRETFMACIRAPSTRKQRNESGRCWTVIRVPVSSR